MSKQKTKFHDNLPEILPPTEDIIFKMIFAKDKDLLRSMLSSVVSLPDSDFEDIVMVDTQLLPEHRKGKRGVLDIKIRVTSKKIINVEMQKKEFAHLRERVVFYLSRMVGEQIGSGSAYETINRVISIVITDHVLINEDDAHHHRYTLYDPETRSEFTDLLEVHTLELPKLPKIEDGSDLWNWMKFLNVKNRKELKMIAEKSPVMEKAANRLLECSADEAAREYLWRVQLAEADERIQRRAADAEMKATIEAKMKAKAEARGRREGIEKGIEKGMEKGIEKGMEKERAKIIKLIEEGRSAEEIKKFLTQERG
jgi:predicted transposase/invertase (TIGR01784 family)